MTDRICDFADAETGLVQNGQNTFVGQLHQVADDLVVEVVHLRNMPHKMSKGVTQEHIRERVPTSILVPYPHSICTPRTQFCDQFAVSLATKEDREERAGGGRGERERRARCD